MKLIQLKAVTKTYQHSRILEQLSLEIETGERLVLTGVSGSGKTTILRLIAGLIAPDSGSIFLNGTLASAEGHILLPPEKRKIGMVFQDLALWPHMSVRGNLEFGLKAKGIQRNERDLRIKEIAERIDMSKYLDRKPGELSGGEQQRIALARALVLEPEIVLMDEPLSSLDKSLNEHIREEILRLQRALGFTLLYVTHSSEEAKALATRIISIDKGHLEVPL